MVGAIKTVGDVMKSGSARAVCWDTELDGGDTGVPEVSGNGGGGSSEPPVAEPRRRRAVGSTLR